MLGRTNIGRTPNLTTLTVTPSTSTVTHTPGANYDGYSQVTVNKMNLQELTVTPSESKTTSLPSTGYHGFNKVVVNAIPYVSETINSASVTIVSDSRISISNSNNFNEIKYYGFQTQMPNTGFTGNGSNPCRILSYSNVFNYGTGREQSEGKLTLVYPSITVTITTSTIYFDITNSDDVIFPSGKFDVWVYGKTS